MAVNKVVYNNNTLIDLTSDTVDATKLLKGYTAHDKKGVKITGTYEESKPTGSKNITTNGTYDVTNYASAVVNVPVPSGYVKPSGNIDITTSGKYDVTNYATATVEVSGGGNYENGDELTYGEAVVGYKVYGDDNNTDGYSTHFYSLDDGATWTSFGTLGNLGNWPSPLLSGVTQIKFKVITAPREMNEFYIKSETLGLNIRAIPLEVDESISQNYILNQDITDLDFGG